MDASVAKGFDYPYIADPPRFRIAAKTFKMPVRGGPDITVQPCVVAAAKDFQADVVTQSLSLQ